MPEQFVCPVCRNNWPLIWASARHVTDVTGAARSTKHSASAKIEYFKEISPGRRFMTPGNARQPSRRLVYHWYAFLIFRQNLNDKTSIERTSDTRPLISTVKSAAKIPITVELTKQTQTSC